LPNSKQIVSAVRWLAVGRFAGQAVSWIVTILVMRILSPADYGLTAMGATLIALIALVSEFGFGTAVVQAKDITRQQSASVFGAAILFGIGSFALVVAMAPLIGDFYRDQRVSAIVQLAGLTFVVASLATIPDAMLRRELNFKLLALIDFSSTLIGSIVTYLLALRAFEYWALIVGPLTYTVCRTILLHLVVRDRVFPSFRISPAFQLIKFGGQVAGARLAGYAVTQSDIVFAGRFLGKDALGYYTVALDLALMPINKIMSIVNQVALPALARTAREHPEARGTELLAGLQLLAYVIFPCLMGMAAIAPWLIPALLGEKWAPAVLPLQIVALALPLRVVANFVSTATVSFGRPDIDVKDKLTSAVVFPCCFFVGVQYGVVELSIAWLLAVPLSLLINLHRTRKALSIGFRSILQAILKPALLSGMLGISLLIAGRSLTGNVAEWIIVGILIALGVAIYSMAFWYFDKQRMQMILKIFGRR
jgi:teichuronic acid exporter